MRGNVRVRVDGTEVEVDPKSVLLDAIKKAGVAMHSFCQAGEIYRGASCRLCLVELPNGKLVPACAFPVSDGLEVRTRTAKTLRVRRSTLELLLAYHRIECWACMRKGDCVLVKMATDLRLDGIPVCAECPLHPEECLLSKGILCLGPLTLAGCDAECPATSGRCWGCRGPVTREDIVVRALKRYMELGFNIGEVVETAEIFWSAHPFLEKIKLVTRGI